VNVPNAITLSRLVVTAATFVCLECTEPLHPSAGLVWLAFVLFLIAAFTDFLDGYLARKWQMVTALGRVADPFADKVLTAGCFVILLKFPADKLGKWKMVAQCWTIGALMTLCAGTQFWHWAAVGGYWVSLALTIVSGVNYVWKARDVLFAPAGAKA